MRGARAALVLVLLLAAPAAWAAPVIVIAAYVAASYGVISYAVAAVIMIAATAYGSLEARRKAAARAAASRAAYNASLTDRSVTLLRADPPWRIVYGECVDGGDIVAMFTSDKQGQRTNGQLYTKPDGYKHLVIVVAAHEVEGIDEMYIDGVAVGPLDANGWATEGEFVGGSRQVNCQYELAPGEDITLNNPMRVLTSAVAAFGLRAWERPPAAPYSLTNGDRTLTNTGSQIGRYTVTYTGGESYVRWSKHLGAPGQQADAWLRSVVPNQWAASDLLAGLAYAVVTLDLEQTRFQGGPPNFTWRKRGRKALDVRTGLVAYTTNNAVLVHDFLTAEWGYGVALTDVHTAHAIAAANACDQLNAFREGEAGYLAPLYDCNGAFSTDQDRAGVLDELLASMAGTALHGAQWSIHAGVWTPPVMDLDDNDLVGQAEIIQAGAGYDEVLNGVRGQYVPRASAVPDDYDAYQSAAALAADGRELWDDLPLPYTNRRARCLNLARIRVEASRDALVVRAPCKLKAWPFEFNDRVRLTNREYGWSAKVFRVTDWQYGVGAPVLLTLQEDGAEIWDQADAATAEQLPNTGLPNPWVVAQPQGVTAASGDAWLQVRSDGSLNVRVVVQWQPIADGYVVTSGRVEVVWRSLLHDDVNVWHGTGALGSDTQAPINGAVDGDVLTIGVRLVNSLGAQSGWVYISHDVVGKRAPPSDVASLAFRTEQYGVRLLWPAVADRDVVGYLIRTNGSSWEAAGDEVRAAGTDYLLGIPAESQFTAWIKALDNSGRVSANAAGCVVNVGAPPAPVVSYAIEGPNEVLRWTFDPGVFFALDHYEVRYGATWATAVRATEGKATEWVHRVDYVGSRRYWVAGIDVAGRPSTPTALDVRIDAPGAPTSPRVEVIDNNALLYWAAPATGSLPVERYEVRKGATWAAGVEVGSNGNSTFTAIFEQQAGSYIYWVAAWDTAGNLGAATAIPATINQPPDYVLRTSIDSDFSGAKTNLYREDGGLIGPRDTTETWAGHFSGPGWASPQAQIDAGYPIYAQPGLASGSYEESFDYGVVLPSTTITVTAGTQAVAGVVTVGCQIYTKANAADAWVAAAPGWSALREGFRYARVVVGLSCVAGVSLVRLASLNIKLSSKLRTDSGQFTITDANAGVWVPFSVPFIDASTPVCQANGTTPLICVVDFADVPNPTGFRVYLYTTAGARVTGSGSHATRGY
ncbi:MAG: hypothetical protein LCH73_02970 [Proteobacteria bacterium]|nr:hypothetical protein [Pseudomonadota bacterium]